MIPFDRDRPPGTLRIIGVRSTAADDPAALGWKAYFRCFLLCGSSLALLSACLHTADRAGERPATERLLVTAADTTRATYPRLRGPRVPTGGPRAAGTEEEHPHPLHPRSIDSSGRAADGRQRLVRNVPRSTERPLRRGLLHAHTWFSDGSGTPAEAFARARALGLDFLAVTEHNHAAAESGARGGRRDGVLIADRPELYEAPGPVSFTRRWTENGTTRTEQVTATSVVRAAQEATDESFVAFAGQEYSTISSGNHVNVIGWGKVLTVPNGDFAALYAGFGEEMPVLQLNHPDVHADLFYRGSSETALRKMHNDYGLDDFGGDFANLAQAADPLVALIEIVTGPAMAEQARPNVTGDHHERDYYYYLVQGLHLSPSVGHDNHYRTWGDTTPARMGVFTDDLSPGGLLAAMRANRTFASEDADLRIDFHIGAAGMGDVLMLAADTEIVPRVRISDPTDADTGYEVALVYGDVQAQSLDELVEWVPEDGLTETVAFSGGGELTFDTYLASGLPEFFYVRVTQADRDRAWSAPIWINHPRARD